MENSKAHLNFDLDFQDQIEGILKKYNIQDIRLALFTFFAYESFHQVEKDVATCNAILLDKPLSSAYESRILHYPIPDSEVIIEPEDDFVSISIDGIFRDAYCHIPIWLFKSILELIGAYLKFNGRLFYQNHQLIEKGNYFNGKRAGEWITYFESGKVLKKAYFEAGLPLGIWEVLNLFKNVF